MDFLDEYKPALALAGTVALPFPFPASGSVFLVIPDRAQDHDTQYLKIVEIVNEKQFKTWFVERQYVRAVRIPAAAADKPGPYLGWTLKTGKELKDAIDAAVKILDTEKGRDSVLVYQQAIVLVWEFAPVISRFEFVTTAAECGDECVFKPCNPCNPPCT